MGTVIAFPNQKRRVEIRALDEQLAGIALKVRGLSFTAFVKKQRAMCSSKR